MSLLYGTTRVTLSYPILHLPVTPIGVPGSYSYYRMHDPPHASPSSSHTELVVVMEDFYHRWHVLNI